MTLYQNLEYRELIKQVTDPELEKKMDSGPLSFYVGFDPTSDSLHVGHLLPLLTMRRFQLAGHKAIAVVGGATGLIGDPSGKSQERKLLSQEDLNHNLKGITSAISQILDLKGSNPAQVLNNFDWFRNLSYLDFLRDVGKHFTVNHMVAKESVRARLEDREHGISYTEFSYMLVQAYDFYHLYHQHSCSLQLGGSDQWGNITAGCELIRREAAVKGGRTPSGLGPSVYGMTLPLVEKSDGTKFGKTESGAVWLDPEKTTPYQFYQFFLQTADADVVKYLKYFTFLEEDEIEHLAQEVSHHPEKREAQKTLASKITETVHGADAVKNAQGASSALFSGDIKNLDEKTLLSVFSNTPAKELPAHALGSGVLLVDLLVESGLSKSKGASRKEIAGGGIYLNNERISDPQKTVTTSDLIASHYLVLRKGKKNYSLIRFKK